jgi:hypothetical protein
MLHRLPAGTAIVSMFILGLASQSALAASASDFVFNRLYTGPISIKSSGVTTECDSTLVNTCYGGDVNNPTLPAGTPPGDGTYNETTWGILNVTTIEDEDGVSLWSEGGQSQKIMGFVYGIADQNITVAGSNVNIRNVGCQGGGDCDGKIHLDYYIVDSFTGFSNFPISNRTAFDAFTNVTTGNGAALLAKTTFDPRDTVGDFATLIQTVGAATLPTAGEGNFFASCDSGPVCDGGVNSIFWDTDGFTRPDGEASDFFGQFTLEPLTSGPAFQAGWLGDINDPIETNNGVPVPGPLLLLGPGLIGLALSLRRRQSRRC